MSVHVFFDNSNVWGGAQAFRQLTEPVVPWVALRIHFRNLFTVVEKGRVISTAVLAGSVPPSCGTLWQYARDHGYETNLLKRVESDDGGVCEQGVDEVLHLKMANAILDFERPQTLVVVTGDGRTSEFSTGFPTQIVRALKKHWDVELYSWSPTLNRRTYSQIESDYPNKFRINLLDPFYEYVTFVQAGNYYVIENGTRKDVSCQPRFVKDSMPVLNTPMPVTAPHGAT